LGEALTPIQLLWINAISDVFPGIGLALERADPQALAGGPVPAQQPLLAERDASGLLAEGTTVAAGPLLAGLWAAARFGAGSPQMRSMTFGALVCAQLQHALVCRQPADDHPGGADLAPNPRLTAILAASFAMQGAAFFAPPLRRALGLAPVGLAGGGVMTLAGLLPSLLMLLRRTGRWRRCGGVPKPATRRG
jgi:Ca2+-transporting ATPase